MPKESPFTPELFRFLRDLEKNNDRAWFEENRERYERCYREPGLRFVVEAAPLLAKMSPHVVADPRPVGGSMMRIHRDTRFSKDKTPYKTFMGIGFHHRGAADDEPSPGFFLHLGRGERGLYAGVWHPETKAQKRIREGIAGDPDAWRKARKGLTLIGESLVKAPKGFDPEHPLVEDLRRKDFVASVPFEEKEVVDPAFLATFAKACRKVAPLNAFLAGTLGLPW